MMKKWTFPAFAIAAALAGSAQAAAVGISADIGSTGVGVRLTLPTPVDRLNVRLGVAGASYSADGDTVDVSYDLSLRLRTASALLDYHPFAGRFRISSGIVYNGSRIGIGARPRGTGTYTINGRTYAAADAGEIAGRIDFRRAAPYLGVGFGNALASGAGFSSDFGVLFQGSPRTRLRNNGCVAEPELCSQLAADIGTEELEVNDKIDGFSIYPVITVGLHYRF